MNTLTARSPRVRYRSGLDRVARRTGLALVRWSSRGVPAEPSAAEVQRQRRLTALAETSRADVTQLVLLQRPF